MIRTPHCPLCGEPPMLVVGDSQAFCGNDACETLKWELTATAAENLHVDPATIEAPAAEMAGVIDVGFFGRDEAWNTIRPRLDQAAAALTEAGHRCRVVGEGDMAGLNFDDEPEHLVVVKALVDAGLPVLAAAIVAEARRRGEVD